MKRMGHTLHFRTRPSINHWWPTLIRTVIDFKYIIIAIVYLYFTSIWLFQEFEHAIIMCVSVCSCVCVFEKSTTSCHNKMYIIFHYNSCDWEETKYGKRANEYHNAMDINSRGTPPPSLSFNWGSFGGMMATASYWQLVDDRKQKICRTRWKANSSNNEYK